MFVTSWATGGCGWLGRTSDLGTFGGPSPENIIAQPNNEFSLCVQCNDANFKLSFKAQNAKEAATHEKIRQWRDANCGNYKGKDSRMPDLDGICTECQKTQKPKPVPVGTARGKGKPYNLGPRR